MTSRSSSPRTDRPRLPTDVERDAAGVGLHPAAVQRLGDHRVQVDRARVGDRLGGLDPGQRDQVLHQVGQPLRLLPHLAGEPAHRLGVVGGVLDRLGQQRQRADRGLELVAGVGHEVPLDLFHPAAFGLVLGQHEDQPAAADGAAERRHPDGEARRPAAEPRHRDLELALPDLPVPAYLAGQRGQLADHQAVALDQPERPGRGARPQHPVVAVDDHGGGGEHGQDRGDARRQPAAAARARSRDPRAWRGSRGPAPGSYRHAISVIRAASRAGQGGDQ